MTFLKKKLIFVECQLFSRIASTFTLAPGQMLLPPSPSDLLLRKGPVAAFSQLKLPRPISSNHSATCRVVTHKAISAESGKIPQHQPAPCARVQH